ncbi:Uma2 family endonuclease [Synechocystis salina]|uniref:Uma2 family endonuclease n=1 Tax=Synechocystis salina LEGE 00031 TaxID=1828736 RepID=A0ABR9VNS8_9SYNC|nr:Uma2 family endonuclease [Synechocystis salina]MBE9239845.1 Uma2 family endonuclease [Synechocystis salina LEGE 00041]MBE9252979.1 Uma2 family endonuclease [Synechocystis salina LEGE 00031]
MVIAPHRTIIYPDSDGQPMADNTEQFQWIVLLKENLECLFGQDANIFVAGDLLWYPVEGHPEIRVAPDAMVTLGRPKGKRGSYRQWEEDNTAPQVVFEILSPGNRAKEMIRKLQFYERYGVNEYYVYDPDDNELTGLQRGENGLEMIETIEDWTSPLLGIRFLLTPDTLEIYYPDGRKFLTTVEFNQEMAKEKQRADRLAAKLKELGVDPEEI